jgi:hypothetical protein
MKSLNQKNKKGEMTSKQLITVIILIISFVIILFFWSMFDWQGDINRETCHTSVILRASATFKGAEFMDNIPLKCQTDRICFKSGLFGKGCDIQGENVRNVNIGSKDALLDFIAEDSYSWHKTLGEGKVNPFETTWVIHSKHCLINSIYSLDNKTKEIIAKDGGITYGEIYKKLESKTNLDGASYFKEMYGTDLDSYLSKSKSDSLQVIVLNQKINLDKNYALIGGIIPGTNRVATGAAIGAGIVGGTIAAIVLWPIVVPVAAGGSAVSAVVVTGFAPVVAASSGVTLATVGSTIVTIGGIATATAVSSSAATAASGIVFFSVKDDPTINFAYIPPALIEYDVSSLKGLECDAFESLA